MLDVLSGFLVVVIVIALGFLVGRRDLLGPRAVYTLNMFVFWIATPALLINFLSQADLADVFGENLAVVVLSSVLAGLVGFLGFRHLAERNIWPAPTATGQTSASPWSPMFSVTLRRPCR